MLCTLSIPAMWICIIRKLSQSVWHARTTELISFMYWCVKYTWRYCSSLLCDARFTEEWRDGSWWQILFNEKVSHKQPKSRKIRRLPLMTSFCYLPACLCCPLGVRARDTLLKKSFGRSLIDVGLPFQCTYHKRRKTRTNSSFKFLQLWRTF